MRSSRIGRQQLGVTASGEISWDMIRDALIREVTFGGTTCPTEEVCCLMAAFLRRLPLPRSCAFPGHDPARKWSQYSPLATQEDDGLLHLTVSRNVLQEVSMGVEYPLNVVKLYWSRAGIMHVAIAWDNKPLLLLPTALLPNRTTESFQMEAETSV